MQGKKKFSIWEREYREKIFYAFQARFRAMMQEKDFGVIDTRHPELGVSGKTLLTYRNRSLPSLETLFWICNRSYYNMNWLFKGEEPKNDWSVESFPRYTQKFHIPKNEDKDDNDDEIYEEKKISLSEGDLKKVDDSLFIDRKFIRSISGSGDCAFMSVDEEAFAPVINKGDLVLFDREKTIIIPGGIYVVVFNRKVLLRQIFQNSTGISLTAQNKKYSTIRVKKTDEIRIMGRVLWSCRSYGVAPVLDD